MATDKIKAPSSRSLIPVPRTCSLQRLNQIQSTENLSVITPKPTLKSPVFNRRITRHSSVSRLPICNPTRVKVRPSITRSITGLTNSSCDLYSINNFNNQTNINKRKVEPKLFKPNDNPVSCQRYQRNHNQNQIKPNTSFKIYNKFSPYYENESLDSQNSDNTNCNQKTNTFDFDCISSISSSAEESANSSRIIAKSGIQQRSGSQQSIVYRTHSVPEHIQQISVKYDSNIVRTNEILENKLIEKLKTKLIQSIDNEDEEEVLEDNNDFNDNQNHYEMSQNMENKLLRIVIRHLKDKLNNLKTNLDQMTQQFTSNKQMCEALQKSLSAMTIRAQQLTQQFDIKQTEFDTISHQLNDKSIEYQDLNRKYQQLDTDYKKLNNNLNNNNINNENSVRTDSSMSTMSFGDNSTDGSTRVKFRSTSSWLRGTTLSKAFKRRKKLSIFSNSSSDLLSTSKIETSESVTHLKDLIRQKEITISDLRHESLTSTNRLEKLEDDLKNIREETKDLKKNKEFLENMIKMKIIE